MEDKFLVSIVFLKEMGLLLILHFISVPLKWDELNINQIAPERGDNRVL